MSEGTETKITLPDGVELLPFEPVVMVNEELGLTIAVFEDVPYVAKPLHKGVYHFVDELRAMEDDRLVGVQFWVGVPSPSSVD